MKFQSDSEDYYVSIAKQLVEENLGWGSSETWSHSDFVEASEIISEKSGVAISVTTIKRIWGKVKHSGSPAISTLNALAVFLGHENWREFKLNQDAIKKEAPDREVKSPETEDVIKQHLGFEDKSLKLRKKKNLLIPYFSTLVLLVAGIYFLSGKEKEPEAISEGDILFNSEPVAKGLPNTVVFNYDITAFDFDSAFIQQNWDARRRQKIEKENKQLTSVYYYPGHFNAKLLLNDKVIKEHGLLIPTEGWLGIIDREGFDVPAYISPENLIIQNSLKATFEVLQEKKVDTNKDFELTYANSKDFGVDGDNFILETALKNNLTDGGFVCQYSGFLLDGEKGIFWFPLSAPGCIGNLSLQMSEVSVSGKTTDLSSFGSDLSDWNYVKLVVKNKNLKLYVQDRLVYSGSYLNPIRKIMGINFKFIGTGAVDYVRLKNIDEEVVYEDNFNEEDEAEKVL